MRTVYRRSGSEGPTYDPYSYSEITVDSDVENASLHQGSVTIHTGLAVWLKVDGEVVTQDETEAYDRFTALTGMTPDYAEDVYWRIRSRCKCGSYDLREVDGFPGETFTVCCKCGEAVAYDFDERAII